jgi:hypothetical protein
MNFMVYDSTGRIVRHGSCPEVDFLSQASHPGEMVMEGTANDSTQYILDGVLTDKPAQPMTVDKTVVNVNEPVTIANVLPGTSAEVDGESAIVDDGILEVIFDTSGEYGIRLSLFPYLDYEATIKCN